MLPISLTIQGLYSYKTRQTIDFRALTADHLFGIFGSVGTGKSSILDAITFALYGEVERVGKRDELNRNIFNRQSEEFLIDFEFETGAEGDLYRFVVRNGRKKNGEPNSFVRSAYIWKSGDWLPISNPDASQIFNLSYDNFKRTVIIPQGRFQEFLQLGGKERTQMLMELFPKVAEFDLQDKVAVKKKATELEIASLAGNLEALGEISEASLELENQKIAEAEARLKVQEAELNLANQAFKKLEDLRLIFEELEKANLALQVLEKDKAAQEQKRKELDRYELIFKTFDSDFKLLDKAKSDVGKANRERDSSQIELTKAENLLQKAKAELEETKALADQLPDWEKQLADWKYVGQILELKEEVSKGEKLLAEVMQNLQTKNEALDFQKSALKTAKEELDKTESETQDLTQLLEAEQFFKEEVRLQKELLENEQKLKSIENKTLALKNQKESALSKDVLALLVGVNSESKMGELLPALAQSAASLEQQIRKLQHEKEDLLKSEQLFNFSTQLADGEPCPLCGSVHHPDVISVEDVTSLKLENAKRSQVSQLLLKEMGEAATKLNGLQAELKGVLENRKDLIEIQLEIQTDQTELKTKFSNNLFITNGFEALNSQLERNRKSQTLLAKLKSTVRELEQKIQLEEPKIGILQTHQNELNQKLATGKGQIQALEVQIKSLKQEEWNLETLPTSSLRINGLESKIDKTRTAFETTQATHMAAENQFNRWNTTLQLQKDVAEKANSEFALQAGLVDEKIKSSNLGDEQSIRFALGQNMDTISLRKSLELFFNSLLTAEEKVKNLRLKTENKLFNDTEWSEAKQKFSDLDSAVLLEKENLAVLKSALQNLKQALEKQADLREKVQKLELRKDNLNTLYNLFRGQAFVNYASGIYLKNIVEMANQRFFRLTKQKLRLVLDGDNNFYVKDFLNVGHERLAKTLSGGQTFQASLSLALALADNVRHLTQSPRNFFFLDEGFGSLDKEALSLVFDTLHQLRHENRIVGIISHVEEMQQEIDKCLMVRMDEEKGSVVEMMN